MKPKKRHLFLQANAFIYLFCVLNFTCTGLFNENEFSVGLIADCQFSRGEDASSRKYALSETKLKDCIACFNKQDLAFVIQLGDFIDRDYTSFDVVLPIFSQLKVPGYHVLGNHDFAVEDSKKSMVSGKLGMPDRFYDFTFNNWHFIILDGNDISFQAYPQNSENFKKADRYYQDRQLDVPKWNGAVGKQQLTWLQTVLDDAQQKDENIILFSHFPVYPDNSHNLWNAGEITGLIERYPAVRAFISGHNHAGDYAIRNGIHYLTLKGMVETHKTAYAIMKLSEKKIEISGFGREINRILHFK